MIWGRQQSVTQPIVARLKRQGADRPRAHFLKAIRLLRLRVERRRTKCPASLAVELTIDGRVARPVLRAAIGAVVAVGAPARAVVGLARVPARSPIVGAIIGARVALAGAHAASGTARDARAPTARRGRQRHEMWAEVDMDMAHVR